MTRQRAVLLVIVLLTVVVGVGFYWPFGAGGSTLTLPGVVEIQEVRLASKVGGRVQSIEVDEGQIVEAGRLLVRIDVPELKAQREQAAARVGQAEAELTKANVGPRPEEKLAALAALDAAKSRLARMNAGWRVEERQQAEGEFTAAEADAKLAEEEYRRAEKLIKQDNMAISKAEWDVARFARERSRSRLAAAKARMDMLHAGNRQEDIDEAEAEVRRIEANYRLLEIGTRQEDKDYAAARLAELKARLQEIDANLKEADVHAIEPVRIEVMAVRPGDVVAPNQPVVRVLRSADLWVKVYVPETQLEKVRVGQNVTVRIDSSHNRTFDGKVTFVASESEFTPRNVQSVDERRHQVFGVKVRVDKPDGIVKAGMAAEVTFHE